MEVVEEASVAWFVAFMRLHNRGVIPMVTPSEFMPTRTALADYFGYRSAWGYVFDDQGLPSYEIYVRQLYSRVLQQPWPVSGVLPFHFARGLFVEALGMEVNWAVFAFRATHPHQSQSDVPRLLPEYKALESPLPALAVVMPMAHRSAEFPLAAAIARHLNAEGGSSMGVQASQTEETETPAFDNPRDAVVTERPPGLGLVLTEMANSDGTPKISRAPVPRSDVEVVNNGAVADSVTLDADQISALTLLRPSFTACIDNERVRLLKVKHDVQNSVSKLRKCLSEQRHRLNLLERKVLEKTRRHEKASVQFRRAREVMNANKLDVGASATKGGGPGGNSAVRMCEHLVNSWMEKAADEKSELQSWDLKFEKQKELVGNSTGELAAAEEMLKEKVEVLDMSLKHLRGLGDLLATL